MEISLKNIQCVRICCIVSNFCLLLISKVGGGNNCLVYPVWKIIKKYYEIRFFMENQNNNIYFFILGAIILDTVNFSKEVNKATPLDHEIVLYLESMMKLNNFENER